MLKISDGELAVIIKESSSLSEAMRKCGRNPKGASFQFFCQRIQNLKLDTSHFTRPKREPYSKRKITWRDILVKKNTFGREYTTALRKAFKAYSTENNIPYICNVCKLTPIWNNQPLRLQIDHINEINNDNRPKNLQWICPNCHTQKSVGYHPHKKKI